MSYTINDSIHAKWSGGTRKAWQIKYIVLHYTANSGTSATAKTNASYFRRTAVKASAHYCVDTGEEVYQCLPDTTVAWAVGGKKQSTGGGSLYGTCTNTNSISIEMVSCTDASGYYYIPDATIERAAELTRALMAKYSINAAHVVRHYDVTGKLCPRPMCQTADGEAAWAAFKAKLTGASATSEFKVRVTASALNIRTGPGMQYAINGRITDKGVYTITQTSGNWGKLKSGAGWISINAAYCTRL